MTAREVLLALCGHGSNCLWNPTRLVAVPNTTQLVGWEADLLLLFPSGWVWEVEIKVSVSDFRREFRTKESKHLTLEAGVRMIDLGRGGRPHLVRHANKHVGRYYFAMPKAVYDKVEAEIPAYAGVIVLDPDNLDGWKRLRPRIVRKAKLLPGTDKTGDKFRIELLRLAHARFWTYLSTDPEVVSDYGRGLVK